MKKLVGIALLIADPCFVGTAATAPNKITPLDSNASTQAGQPAGAGTIPGRCHRHRRLFVILFLASFIGVASDGT